MLLSELKALVAELRETSLPTVDGCYVLPVPDGDRIARKRAIVNKLRERWQRAYVKQHHVRGQFELAARLAKRIRRLTYLWDV